MWGFSKTFQEKSMRFINWQLLARQPNRSQPASSTPAGLTCDSRLPACPVQQFLELSAGRRIVPVEYNCNSSHPWSVLRLTISWDTKLILPADRSEIRCHLIRCITWLLCKESRNLNLIVALHFGLNLIGALHFGYAAMTYMSHRLFVDSDACLRHCRVWRSCQYHLTAVT
jgi:hypothetical protein